MKTLFSLIALIGINMLLTGCGTVSAVTPVAGKEVNFQKYQRVLVLDFIDGVSSAVKTNQVRKKVEITVATKSFPDRIAIELGAKNVFREVARTGDPDAETLVISGTITRYHEGDPVARLLIGMGAGSSYFDATVSFKDGITFDTLATQKIDKNSWQLGGAIAASQTPEEFMREASEKLAEDINSLKLTGKLPEQKNNSPKQGNRVDH